MDLIAVPAGCKKLVNVKLPSLGSEEKFQDYLYDEENLAIYEIVKYSDSFRSWFLDNSFCKEGHINLLTKVDPLYIFLPQLITIAGEQFRPLQDIFMLYNSDESNSGISKLDYALSPNIDWNNVCETKEIDGELFVKFSEINTLEWLLGKHRKTMEALKESLSAQASKATLISIANDLIAQYLPPYLLEKFKENVKKNSGLADELIANLKSNNIKKHISTTNEKDNSRAAPKKTSNSQASIMNFLILKKDTE